VSRHGIRAVLGVPVHLAGETVGALDGYVDRPYEWDETHVRALQAYADLVGSLLASAVQARQRSELAGQLQHALNSRVVIERAVGMIMGREHVDAVTAFNRLRRQARNRRDRVADLAERVLEGMPLDS
jgi:GAF domain-containing protein